jgi:hypothetical protein
MKQELNPLQIGLSIAVVVCIVAVVGFITMFSKPTVPVAAVIPPPSGTHGAKDPGPSDKSGQVVGPGSIWTPPARSASGSTSTNGAPAQPIGPPPPRS